jgi:hypothetical protein
MATNVNPGPNIVNPTIIRGASVVSIPSPIGVSVTANSSGVARVPVQGVLPGDVVTISPNIPPATGLNIVGSWVDSANSVTIVYINSTAGALSPASDTYNAYVVRGYPVTYDFGVTYANNTGIVAATNP